MREEGENKIGCLASWIILGVIGITFAIIEKGIDLTENIKENMMQYFTDEFGVVMGTIIFATIPIIILISITLLGAKIFLKK